MSKRTVLVIREMDAFELEVTVDGLEFVADFYRNTEDTDNKFERVNALRSFFLNMQGLHTDIYGDNNE